MMLLVLACICLPSQIRVVDGINQHVVFVRCNMSVMGVVSLVALSLVRFSLEGRQLHISLKLDLFDISWTICYFIFIENFFNNLSN